MKEDGTEKGRETNRATSSVMSPVHSTDSFPISKRQLGCTLAEHTAKVRHSSETLTIYKKVAQDGHS